jgi:hypothetical protein
METSNTATDIKNLNDLLTQINVIYAESKTKSDMSVEKTISNYNQGSKCIDLASQLLSKIQSEINSMDLTHVNNVVHQSKINNMIDILENPKLSLPEALRILTDLKKLRSEVETTTTIISNVKQDEVLLEEVMDF